MDYQEIQQIMNSTNSGDPLTSFLALLQLLDEPLVKTSHQPQLCFGISAYYPMS